MDKKRKCVIWRKQHKEARVAAGCVLWGRDRVWENVLWWEENCDTQEVEDQGAKTEGGVWWSQKPRVNVCWLTRHSLVEDLSAPDSWNFQSLSWGSARWQTFLRSKCKCWQSMQVPAFRSNWPVCANLTASACSSWKNTTWAFHPPDMSLETS